MAGIKQALPIKESELNAGLVFDMVYNPLSTPLLKLAHSRGIPIISGLEMFVQQGARQFEIWTGKPAPEAEMQRVVELALRKRTPEPSAPRAEPAPHSSGLTSRACREKSHRCPSRSSAPYCRSPYSVS